MRGGTCPCCGEPFRPGDYRCDGELPDGTVCGKDLLKIEQSNADTVRRRSS